MSVNLTVLRDKGGPDADPKRTAMRRLGADLAIVPDEAQPRLVHFREWSACEMHVVMPPRRRRWWEFWRASSSRAIHVYGHGCEWYPAWTSITDGGRLRVHWRSGRPIDSATSAILATLWVNREKLVERKD